MSSAVGRQVPVAAGATRPNRSLRKILPPSALPPISSKNSCHSMVLPASNCPRARLLASGPARAREPWGEKGRDERV
jgi:hypothetical protein